MLNYYRLTLYLAFPLVMLRLFCRALRDRRYFENLPQRLGFTGFRPDAGGIWVHAVSVGEANAAIPLIEYLLKQYPHKPVTVTTMTPTGAERVTKTFAERSKQVRHCYLPYDYPGATRRFLNRINPCLAVVMETEIWPNLIASCHNLGIPMMYVNVRLSNRSYQGYHRFRALIKPTLAKIHRFAVQTQPEAERLSRLGALPAALTVTGNIKFDCELQPNLITTAQSMRSDWGAERPVWVAGSTHEGEEAQILTAFAHLRKEFNSLLLVLAPRHPQRCVAVFRRCARKYNTVLHSQNPRDMSRSMDIYLVDTIGELPMLIAASDITFVGGSMVPVGGHNVLEAAAAGIPVVFGQYMFNFAEVANLLLQHTAGIQVMNTEELTDIMHRLLSDRALRHQYGKRGKELVEKNRGALQKICALLEQILENQLPQNPKQP